MDFFDFLDSLQLTTSDDDSDWLTDVIECVEHTHLLNEPAPALTASELARQRGWARKGQAKYRKAHPGRVRVRASNRRARQRELPNTLTHEQWEHCLEYFEYRCAVCGRPAGLWHTIAQDHWIPLTANDNNPGTAARNIVPLCHGISGCNNSKSDADATMWLIQTYGKAKARNIEKRIQDYFTSLARTAPAREQEDTP